MEKELVKLLSWDINIKIKRRISLLTFDIFCEVIDNFGDIGVVYRFANELLKKYNKLNKDVKIRVFFNKTDELTFLDSSAKNIDIQTLNNIDFITFNYLEKNKENITPSDIIVEAFGYNIPDWYLEKAKVKSSLLINLEYLSCEEWILDFHLQESPLGAPKLKKFFFMPGLSEKSGGVILPSINNVNYNTLYHYSKFLTSDFLSDKIVASIFTYEYNFENLFSHLNCLNKESVLLCLGEKTQVSIKYLLEKKYQFSNLDSSEYLGKFDKIHILFIPFMSQIKYDSLLSLCDFNFVRGEDSFIRGVLSSKPFLWHAYLQEESAHLEKIKGFLTIYNKFFKPFNNNRIIEAGNAYSEIMYRFNYRTFNSFEEKKEDGSLENFSLFFSNLQILTNMSKEFSKHIISQCNLIDKFVYFVNNRVNY